MSELVDMAAFRVALERKRTQNDMSAREVCRQAGVSEATYSRLMNGKMVDLRTFGALCHWLRIPADIFVGKVGDVQPDTKTAVMMLLASDPELAQRAGAVLAVLDLE